MLQVIIDTCIAMSTCTLGISGSWIVWIINNYFKFDTGRDSLGNK